MKNTIILSLSTIACVVGACGDETTGKRVTLATQVVTAPEVQTGFTNFPGWNIKLTHAALASGPLYYFDGSPAFVKASAPSLWQRLGNLVMPSAYAHPGHYAEGVAKGQMLRESSLDLLGAATALGSGDGVTGLYRSATFAFAPPLAGPALALLAGNSVLVEGVATKAETQVHFRIAVDFAEIGTQAREGLVQGCTFEEVMVGGDGLVTLTVKPHVWFNLVDFTGAEPGSAEAPTEIVKGSTAHIAFVQGLVQLSAYHFSFTPMTAR